MESVGHVTVPLKVGGKKMRKRKELDALVAHSIAKRACSGKRNIAGNGIASHDQLLSQSTDDQEDYSWPKVRTNLRCRDKRLSCLRTCGPIIFGMCIVLSLGFMYWLYFDIRQQISDYRVRIEQVSATSQNVPDALQKWHETSKDIGNNQTILFDRIALIQQELKNVSLELKQLKDQVDKKNEHSQESQLKALQTNVATLGSKIENTLIDVTKLKEHYNDLQEEHNNMTSNINNLKKTFDVSQSVNITPNIADNLTQQTIENIKQTLTMQLQNLSTNVSAENSFLKERITWIDTDLKSQKKNLEALTETSMHINSQVSSIENFFNETKQNATILNEKVTHLQNDTQLMKNSMNLVQNEYSNYHNQYDQMFKEIDTIKLTIKSSNASGTTGVIETETKENISTPAIGIDNPNTTVISKVNSENKDLSNNNISTPLPSSASPLSNSSTSLTNNGGTIVSADSSSASSSPNSSPGTHQNNLYKLFNNNGM